MNKLSIVLLISTEVAGASEVDKPRLLVWACTAVSAAAGIAAAAIAAAAATAAAADDDGAGAA